MNRPRILASQKGLPRRVYVRSGRYFFVDRTNKWIPLTRVDQGESAMLLKLAEVLGNWSVRTNFTVHLKEFLKQKLPTLSPGVRREDERLYGKIGIAFEAFDVEQIRRATISKFLTENFPPRSRVAQVYKSRLYSFLDWCANQDLIAQNPAVGLRLAAPPKRDVLITDAQYVAIRSALMPMIQCFVDLCYLTGQRSTDIRSLQWSQLVDGIILFKPSKTARRTAAKVEVPITAAIQAVLDRARTLGTVKSWYVIHQPNGQPYKIRGLSTAWYRVVRSLGWSNLTIKDLRAKYTSDARRRNYSIEDLRESLAHSSGTTTEGYVKQRSVGRSKVELTLPKGCE